MLYYSYHYSGGKGGEGEAEEWIAKEMKVEEKSYRMDLWFQKKKLACQEAANSFALEFNNVVRSLPDQEYNGFKVLFPPCHFCKVECPQVVITPQPSFRRESTS